jgi:tetratricopeptide (TPR) repeat protein
MRRYIFLLLFIILCRNSVSAQNNDLQLAHQFIVNGEPQKALDIYQKLFKQDNETYFNYYINTLISLKKFDEAEGIAKKLSKKYPASYRYTIVLGKIYTQQGNPEKADVLYNELIKNIPPDQSSIAMLANQFYQAETAEYAIKTFQAGRKLLHNDKLFTYELLSLYRYKRDKVQLTEEYLDFLPNNPSFINQAENTFSTLFEGNADYDMLKTALLKKMQKDPQQSVYPQLLTWQYLQQKDFDQALNQELALSRRQNDDGNGVYDLCQTLLTNQAYDAAIRGYEYIISKGKDQQLYIPAKIELINTKNQKITEGKYTSDDLISLEKDYYALLNEFGRTAGTAFAMQKLAALQIFKLHHLKDARKILEEAVVIPNIKPGLLASCKLDLGDVYLMNGESWEATLLYSQVEKDFPNSNIGQDAKFRNAKLAYYTGDFTWAKGQLDILKAATSQLIANDALNLSLLIADNTAFDSTAMPLKTYARADLLIYEEQQERALRTLDSIDFKYPGNNLSVDILMAKSRILIQQKKYNDAISLLKTIVTEHSTSLWADDAVFMLGDLYDNQLADKENAKIYYQKMITDYPGSLYLNEARKRFRLIRGDKPDA